MKENQGCVKVSRFEVLVLVQTHTKTFELNSRIGVYSDIEYARMDPESSITI